MASKTKEELNKIYFDMVESFGEHQLQLLRKHREKKGDSWRHMSPQALLQRVEDELRELDEAIHAEDFGGTVEQFENIMKEAADVGNMVMMIWELACLNRNEVARKAAEEHQAVSEQVEEALDVLFDKEVNPFEFSDVQEG